MSGESRTHRTSRVSGGLNVARPFKAGAGVAGMPSSRQRRLNPRGSSQRRSRSECPNSSRESLTHRPRPSPNTSHRGSAAARRCSVSVARQYRVSHILPRRLPVNQLPSLIFAPRTPSAMPASSGQVSSPRTPAGSPIASTGKQTRSGRRRGHLSLAQGTANAFWTPEGSPIDSTGKQTRSGRRRGHLSLAQGTANAFWTPEGSPVDGTGKQTRSGPRRGHLSMAQGSKRVLDPGGVTYR